MLLLIGIVIGLLLGLTGAGGSVFAVPLLILLGDVSIHQAVTLSLAAVATITLYGSVRNFGNQTILWKPAALLAGSGMLGAPLGQLFASILSEVLLVAGFSLLAVIIAIRMWLTATTMPEASKVVRSSHLSLDNAVPTVNFSCVQDAWVVYCWVDFWSAYYPAYSAWAAVF